MKYLPALVVAFTLPLLTAASCSGDPLAGFAITQNTLDTARASYDAAFLTPAAKYRQQGYCATGTVWTLAKPCADHAIVAKVRAADAIIKGDFDALQGMIDSGDATGSSALYASLETAITTAEGLVPLFKTN